MSRAIAERADALPALAEVFREHGYGASLSTISAATGLGKGSLYHFFPGGKEEMASAALLEIDGWFETKVFNPLLVSGDPALAIDAMLDNVDAYFRSGRTLCLVGVLALGSARGRFARPVSSYFKRWIEALATALARAGCANANAASLAEETVGDIQGSIVLARALDDPAAFTRALTRIRSRLLTAIAHASR